MKNLIFKVVLVIVLIFAVNMTVTASSKEYGYTIVDGSISGTYWDNGSAPDVYIISGNKEVGHYIKTKIVKDSYKPVWNYSTTVNSDYISLWVYDDDDGEREMIEHIDYIDLSRIKIGDTRGFGSGARARIYVRRDK